MKADVSEMEINGVKYIRKDAIKNNAPAEKLNGMDYVIIRTCSAGVHAGYLESREGKEVVLRKTRRIWYWDGAASLSQMAITGVTKPENCKFAMPVEKITLTEAIEIIQCTKAACKNIQGVSVWQK